MPPAHVGNPSGPRSEWFQAYLTIAVEWARNAADVCTAICEPRLNGRT
jgi:hypothetical protein